MANIYQMQSAFAELLQRDKLLQLLKMDIKMQIVELVRFSLFRSAFFFCLNELQQPVALADAPSQDESPSGFFQ